ncbi:solute carrier family 25 member 44-like [Pollicipes pollicipes]|uniref:solute carrier family 25 member 44-like n=1 Tax=Pollicipes pollicipes TaxID=41117 RepID=UPI0018856BC9|nr:solute carrier family 25 member 44-like [Pollicipes pollicipes]XP_037088383.1 solute carrier family 25 member 44-like [Pollicipes pollicipes]XP_037088384.1 solute carrier family 25 member 44-like [Pollicipes pollicipes]
MSSMETQPYIRTIEWEMLDKRKFIPLSIASSFSIRCMLYPFTVIKTRLQVQRHHSVYNGTFDAFRKTFANEGFAGLYRGFWVSAFQLVSGVAYITTYETVRHVLQNCGVQDSRVRALAGGGGASLVGQTIIVPFDVISQHLMVLGQVELRPGKGTRRLNPLRIQYESIPRRRIALEIIKEVYKQDGVRGFYRGYFASICTYVPNSALWWSFYHFYQEQLVKVLPPSLCPLLLMQSLSATLGGVTTTVLTNPLDCVRARYQIQRVSSLPETVQALWAEERWGIFTKGLSARLVSSITFSFMVVLGYESVKRLSINDELKPLVRW